MNAVQVAARQAYAAGLSIYPPREDGSKAPAGAWAPYQHERLSLERCATVWGPASGLGVICGAVSGNLVLYEFDDRGTYEEYKSLGHQAELGDLIARLEAGYCEDTPSGGVHWLYRCSEIDGNTNLARRAKRPDEQMRADDKIKVLIETRGEGGFAILAPSNGSVHPSGKPYVLRTGSFSMIPTITPEEQHDLFALARSFDEMPAADPCPRASASSETGARPGDDFCRRATWPEVLEPHGWREVFTREGVGYWRRPGKAEGVSATVNFGGSDLLIVFSTSTPFDPGAGYNKFRAWAILEHGCDFSAAARVLAEQGFGTPVEAPPRAEAEEPAASPSVPDAEWPAPLREVAYHGPIGRLVQAIAPHTEADPAGLLLQALTFFGSIVGRHPYFEAESARHFPVLFVVLVGVSAKSRKGSSFATVKAPMVLLDPDLDRPGRLEEGLASGEGLIWAVRDPQIPMTGAPVEGVVDKRLLIREEEFASTLRVMARDGNTLSALLRQAWDGKTLGTLTKNNRATATGAHISLIGHITRDELRRYLDRTECGNGFANRILWACVRRARVLPEGGRLGTVDLEALVDPLRAALHEAKEGGRVVRDEEARALWGEVYEDLSEGRPGLFGAMTGRGEAQVMRLALLYAAADGSFVISRAHLLAALEVWRFCRDSVRYTFGEAVGDPVADEIRKALQLHGTMTRTAIRDLLGRNQQAGRINRALAILAEAGIAHMEMDESKPGRPVEVWCYRGYDKNDLNDKDDTDDGDDQTKARDEGGHV
jgi:hypothetical protein